MRYLKKINQPILLLLFVLFFSCQDNNDPDLLFEDVPSVRFEKKQKEVRDFLISPDNGWKMTYFTDNTLLGGFTFLFDFINETEVRMDSDFGNADPARISLYDLSLGSTLKLTFTTKNVIHELSDGNNFPDNGLIGQGYKGSFEFLFSSFQGEDIIFRSNRDPSNFIRFTRATADDWLSLTTSNKIMLGNLPDDLSKSVFRSMVIENEGAETKAYSFSYNENRRFVSTLTNNESGLLEPLNYGIAPTPLGFKANPAIKVGTVAVEDFIYDAINDAFVGQNQGVKITISYLGTPAIPLKGQEILSDFLILHNPFLNSLEDDWMPDFTNENFNQLITNMNAAAFFDVTRIDLYNLETDTGILFITSSFGNAAYTMSKEIKDDKMYLSLLSTTAPQFFSDAIQPLLDVVLDSNGLFVDRPSTLNAFANNVFTFVPASNTTIRFSAVEL
ncbi:DUF4302 domain-containing protein [uncultured Polaribacter sp.]|uniref:DUF4302 domain-containing protein n=1 Tax=uncultured Polaribacter sp. TaxID=174711 RepID=UPI00262E7AB6|nr:DUF4302 domain-containing protein [uncultured Polaribacter sp.]